MHELPVRPFYPGPSGQRPWGRQLARARWQLRALSARPDYTGRKHQAGFLRAFEARAWRELVEDEFPDKG